MKKFLAVCALALTAGYVQAQTTAGRMMIGGNVGYTTQTSEHMYGESKQKNFHTNLQFGYFVVDNLAVGLGVSYGQTKNQYEYLNDADTEVKIASTTLAPFVRYYIFTPNEKFAFYADAGVGIGVSKIRNTNVDEDVKSSTFTAHLSPGFSYFFNEKWSLDLQLSGIAYASNDQNTDSDADNDKSSYFTFGASSLNPALGFRYFIGK
jgi:outer membrane protein W